MTASLFAASRANAWCRTTTCNAPNPLANCDLDANGCATEGQPLFWAPECLSFGVQQDGSTKQHISYQTFDHIVALAFEQWAGADCGGGLHPSFKMWDMDQSYGPVICGVPEFNEQGPNANVWMFRDSSWPYQSPGSTLALTTITFEVETGEILDADVELNSFSPANKLTTSNTDVQSDVQSIVTHEAGHFLGLAHSLDKAATMFANYSPGDISFRTLSADDVAGICSVYPPDREAPACTAPNPVHGFTRYCVGDDPTNSHGCSFTARRIPGSPRGLVSGLVVLAAALRRRRSLLCA